MTTIQELAAKIHGREYGDEVTPDINREAKEAGLVVILGASDDLVELHGAIGDEIGAFGGTTFWLDDQGVIPGERDDLWDDDEMERWFQRRRSPNKIKVEAEWCPATSEENLAWAIQTAASHATFTILEDGEPFCRGIVIELPKCPVAAEQAA